MRLEKKVAIVSGGGSGIGKAIAQAFVREGAHVVIAGRDSKKLALAAEEIGGDCLTVAADVSNAADISKLVDATVAAGALGIAAHACCGRRVRN